MKTVRPTTSPRKQPRQARSRATVEAITQAAAYILVKRGWEGFTTNAIAERAGVNISSLYQFFPNKEAIVAELQRRHIEQTRRKLVEALPRLAGQRSLRDALLLLVGAIVDEHRVAPALHRAFAEELPQSVKCPTEDEVSLRRQALEALRPFMKNVPNPEVAMEIGVVAARAVIDGAATHRPAVLGLPQFREEVVALLQGYLQRRASSA